MSLIIVICFLHAALIIYLVSGGADFGAGVVESITAKGKKNLVRNIMRRSTGPIWEANHMWLILSIVILFVGFPTAYTQLSTAFYIPLTLLLMGIVGRGTSYVFRNGDNVKDGLKKVDNFIYISSSILALFFMGVIAGSAFAAKGVTNANNFLNTYIFNWLAWFPLSIGLFNVVFCGYLATIYVIGNKEFGYERYELKSQAKKLSIALFISSVLVFIVAANVGVKIFIFTAHPVASILVVLSIIYLMWKQIDNCRTQYIRLFVLLPVSLIVIILFGQKIIDFTRIKTAGSYYNYSEQVNIATIDALAGALLIGSLLILPFLGYLMYKFESGLSKPFDNRTEPILKKTRWE